MKTMAVQEFSPHLPDDQAQLTGLDIPKRAAAPQLYTYRWDRHGRKGQTCRVTARGKFNSIRVEFEDGYTMITSGNAIRKLATPTPSSERTAK
jgi:hypothetical protein